MNGWPVLKIFIRNHCPGCEESRRLVDLLAQKHKQMHFDFINLDDATAVIPEAVFATPTFMLDDRIIALGNPSLAELEAQLMTLLV